MFEDDYLKILKAKDGATSIEANQLKTYAISVIANHGVEIGDPEGYCPHLSV